MGGFGSMGGGMGNLGAMNNMGAMNHLALAGGPDWSGSPLDASPSLGMGNQLLSVRVWLCVVCVCITGRALISRLVLPWEWLINIYIYMHIYIYTCM